MGREGLVLMQIKTRLSKVMTFKLQRKSKFVFEL